MTRKEIGGLKPIDSPPQVGLDHQCVWIKSRRRTHYSAIEIGAFPINSMGSSPRGFFSGFQSLPLRSQFQMDMESGIISISIALNYISWGPVIALLFYGLRTER